MEQAEILNLAAEVIQQESAAAAQMAGQVGPSLAQAARLLLECRGHVLVAGSGTSHAVGARLAHLLSCCGTPALFIHPGDAQHGLSGAVTARDVILLISKGGETTEVNYLAKIAKARGACLIALTEKPGSTLGQLADLILQVTPPPGIDPYGMIATGSSLATCVFCDALCVVVLKLRGYSKEAFGQTHPGGAVGIRVEQEKSLPGAG
jgi:arabinose-5-phosphate isomerase